MSLLSKWWSSLLNYLINSNNISNIDKSAYLECISKIISRVEWYHIDDLGLSNNYKELLVLTLDYCINRLSCIKHLTLSMSAFVGKVFAYSFFNIEHVSNALLFLLNIKQAVFDDCCKNFPGPISSHDLDKLYKVFPDHLHYLIDYQGLPQKQNLSDKQRFFLNCLLPPKHPVKGIKDPQGPWVRRWFNSDSDIFNSFLRHYCTITNTVLLHHRVDVSDELVLRLPGFSVILSHIFQIFQVSINRISKNNVDLKFNQEFQVNTINTNKYPSSPGTQNPGSSAKQNETYYNSIFKIFRTLREINYQPDFKFSKSLIEFVDTILISFAKTVTIYDFNKNSLILNLVYEFLTYLDTVNWKFWLNCCYLMIENTDHVQILLKNLSFLFNIWNKIPEMIEDTPPPNTLAWYTNFDESFKENFVDWLISNKIWTKLFIHWNPIIRNYYLRLLIWRVIGINNFESSTSIKVSLKIERKLNQSFDKFHEFFNSPSNQGYYFRPDNPIINRKFLILPISKDDRMVNDVTIPVGSAPSPMQSPIQSPRRSLNEEDADEDETDDETSERTSTDNPNSETNDSNDEVSTLISSSELKKAHPFEIFDETVYSCTNFAEEQPNEDEADNKRSNSLVSSIGKLFKSLTFDESKKSESKGSGKLTKNSKTGSLTSLSNLSVKSRSSSPSIMSFSSTPTSLTDLSNSTNSSGSSDSSKVNLLELFNLPPEIIRPSYKFDLILDQDSLRDKFYLMNQRKYRSYQDFYELPQRPKIPSITIFIASNVYNKFYISTDNLILNDDDYNNINFEPGLFNHSAKTADLINLGKSLFEWNLLIFEFENYLTNKVELHQDLNNLSEFDYFSKIIPLLSLENSSGRLNAA